MNFLNYYDTGGVKINLLDLLNSREWAVLTWVAVISIIMLFNSESSGVLKAAGELIIQPVFQLFTVYQIIFIISIYYFHVPGVTLSMLKDYLTLFFFTIMPFLIKVQLDTFWRTLVKSIGIGAFVEFLLSTYTFSIIVELIIIPIIFLVVAVRIQADRMHLERVYKFLNVTFDIIGIIFIVHAGYRFIRDISIGLSLELWEGFIIKPVIWLANFPLVILAIPMIQFDNIDNFRIKKKTALRVLRHSIFFLIARCIYSRLIFKGLQKYVTDVHFGGVMRREIQIRLKPETSVQQALMIQKLYQYMLAPRDNYKNKKPIIPIRIECREIGKIELKIPAYELPDLEDEYKMSMLF